MDDKNYPWLHGFMRGAAEAAITDLKRGLPESAREHLQWSLDNAERLMNEAALEVSHARDEKTE